MPLYRYEKGVLKLDFHPGQQRAWNSKKRFIFVIAGAQSGKALAIDTKIPTPYGFKLLKDIHIGDVVYDAFGQPTIVVGETEIMYDHKCYEITFSNGQKIIADAEHLWIVLTEKDVDKGLTWNEKVIQNDYLDTKSVVKLIEMDFCLVNSPINGPLFIDKIEEVKSVPVKCISVDSPTHMYLASESFIPTHNTSFGPWWLWREYQEALQKNIQRPIDLIAITSTYSLFRNKMLPELRTVFEDVLGIGTFVAKDSIIYLNKRGRYFDGRIILVSAVKPQAIEAATAYAVWGDEVGQDEFTRETFNALQRRLAIHQGKFLATTTPYNFGWLYEVWLEVEKYKAEGREHPYYDIITFPSYLNPEFPMEEYERMKQELPQWYFEMFYEGKFTKPPNLVFDMFDPAVHLVDPFEVPEDWPVYIGVDFGAQNSVALFVAHDEDKDVYYVIDYYSGSRKTTEEHVMSIEAYGYDIVGAWGGSPGESQFRWDWANAGMDISKPPIADVVAGVNRVSRLFREGRLFIFNHIKPLIKEVQSYSYSDYDKASSSYKAIKRKSAYHYIDALRYVVVGISEMSSTAAYYLGPSDEDIGFYDNEIVYEM